MTETDLYKYVIKKAISLGMKPKNLPKGVDFEEADGVEASVQGNAVVRHSLLKGAYIGLIDSGQPIIDDEQEIDGMNDVTGGYTGLSFVVFTQCYAKKPSEVDTQRKSHQNYCIVSICIGSSSLGDDLGLASKPGFRRSFMNLDRCEDNNEKYFYVEDWAGMETRCPGLIEYVDTIETKDDGKADTSGCLHTTLDIYDKKKLLPAACVIKLPETIDEKGIPALDAWLAQYAIWRGWLSSSKVSSVVTKIFKEKRRIPISDEDTINEIENLLNKKKYIVLQGAPGCGKTYTANVIANKPNDVLASRPGCYDEVGFIQFHAETTYADFVYGIKPVLNGVNVAYKGEKGILLQMMDKAQKELDRVELANRNKSDNEKEVAKKYLLIIDEINRANLANVLGPIFYLFEPNATGRNHELVLGKETIDNKDGHDSSIANEIVEKVIKYKEMPSNLYVIATMNTADKSLAVVDFALRRRFAWYTLYPHVVDPKDGKHFNERLFEEINSLFERYATDDELNLQPGHSYFITDEPEEEGDYKLNEEMTLKLQYEIMPLMKEYFAEGFLQEARNEFAQLYYQYTHEYMYK